MPLTRYERGVIEDLINRVVKLQDKADQLEADLNIANQAIVNLGGNNLLTLSTEEQASALEEAIKNIINKLNVKKHTHLSDEEGGDAFAKKGATLIEEETT